jgi:carbamoyl-phosphate synthase/aspartate carbamoyltransferase
LSLLKNRGSIAEENRFFMAKIISACDFNRQDLHVLFGVAQEMKIIVEKHLSVDILKGMVMCTAFYEPSTRTCVSFEAAMNRLGGSVVSINQITSSIAKGESIADTGFEIYSNLLARTLASYSDVIVMRHPEPGSVGQAADVSPVSAFIEDSNYLDSFDKRRRWYRGTSHSSNSHTFLPIGLFGCVYHS